MARKGERIQTHFNRLIVKRDLVKTWGIEIFDVTMLKEDAEFLVWQHSCKDGLMVVNISALCSRPQQAKSSRKPVTAS